MARRGELAIVLHTHMPYVEGFGTWPFGEEWLWEAIATSYLPLLDVLGRAPITLSLTPVLCDQLEAPGTTKRCLEFLSGVRPESHRLDLEGFHERGEYALAAEIERSAAEYAAAAERLAGLPKGGLLEVLGRHASWTSAATHAVLPMLASDDGIDLQIQTGIGSHRRRFGGWSGGFWLPECGYAPWLDLLLQQAGVRAACVELTADFGLGDRRHLTPVVTEAGPVLWPIDREVMSLVWSADGYPANPAYRNYHALTSHHHRVWRNDGQPYDADAAIELAGRHAAEFVGRVRDRVREGGICVFALDTEFLGHWWYEGVAWLRAAIDESARQGLELTTLDDALDRYEPRRVPSGLGVSTWGAGEDLRTWSAPAVGELAWLARSAELRALAAGPQISPRALRELLALQSSDWAFLASSQLAGEYPRERARGHAAAFAQAIEQCRALDPTLRNLAPELVGWVASSLPAESLGGVAHPDHACGNTPDHRVLGNVGGEDRVGADH
jgi:1,4-alpha-glucan branching enzyme